MKTITPYTAGIQPQGEGWIKLNTNENPYPPSPRVIDALKGADFDRLRRYPDPDSCALSEAVAENLGVAPQNIFCGNGSDEVLAFAFHAFFSGKQVSMPDLGYGFYPVWAAMCGAAVRPIPLCADFTVAPEGYRGCGGVILANPNTPTGLALPLGAVEQIVRENPNGVVIVDEAYIDFSAVQSAAQLTPKYKNLLVVRTFSKSYSLAGLRVGFAAGDKKLIDALRNVKNAFNSYPVGQLAQAGAIAALGDTAYFDKTRKQVIETREMLRARLDCLPSGANFVFWRAAGGAVGGAATDGGAGAATEGAGAGGGARAGGARAVYDKLSAQKILVRHFEHPRAKDYLRITIGTKSEMEELLKCIAKQTKPK